MAAMALMINFCRLWLLLSLFGFSLVSLKRGSSSKSSSSYPKSSLSDYTPGKPEIDETPRCHVKIIDFFRTPKFTAYFGGSVTLPCYCEDPQTKPTEIKWEKGHFGIVYNFTEGYMQPDVNEDYEGRVALVDGSPGNLSLVINDLREEDAGLYTCRTENGGNEVELIIQGCDLAKSGERIEISKLSGESVLLPCWCSEEKAKPKTLTWKDPNGRLIQSYTEQSGRFAPRIEMFNDMDAWNMSLLLSDVTIEDEGVYTCEINGTDKVFISLTVTDCSLSNQDEVVEVEAPPGSSVLLPCTCTNLETKPKSLRWTAPNGRELNWHYKGRSQLFHHTSKPGNLSLLLSGLRPEDEGVYRCEIAEGKSKEFVLTVYGPTHAKQTSDGTEIVVPENVWHLQHLLLFMLAVLILLLITHMTVGAMIIRWRNQGTFPHS